jgi:hypothetical protein
MGAPFSPAEIPGTKRKKTKNEKQTKKYPKKIYFQPRRS